MTNDEEKPLSESLSRASPFLIKVLELILAMVCVVLIFVPYDNNMQKNVHRAGFVYLAFCFAIIINGVFIATHLHRLTIPQQTLYIYSAICALLFFNAGRIALNDWWNLMHSIHFRPPKLFLDMMIGCGLLAVLNGIVFLADIWLTYRYG